MRPDQAMQLVAVRDIGRVVAAVFNAPRQFTGRTVEIAGDALSGDAGARHRAHAVGRPITYQRVPQAALERDEALARSVVLVDDGRLAGRSDFSALRAMLPFPLRFDDWPAGPGADALEAAQRSTPADGTAS